MFLTWINNRTISNNPSSNTLSESSDTIRSHLAALGIFTQDKAPESVMIGHGSLRPAPWISTAWRLGSQLAHRFLPYFLCCKQTRVTSPGFTLIYVSHISIPFFKI